MIISASLSLYNFTSLHLCPLPSTTMATNSILTSKSFKWFFNKSSFKLSLPKKARKPESLYSSSPLPMSPARISSRREEKRPLQSSRLSSVNTSSSREEELEQVFRHFDGDGNGKISSLELKTYFASIGEYMSLDEAQSVINDLDTDGDGLLNFREFTRLMERDSTIDDDLRRAFEMFEAETGSGCITPNSLQRMLNRLGDEKSYEECEAMIRVYDLDENGTLDFHEFHKMMA